MKLSFRQILLLSLLVFSIVACRKKALDEYYGRPATLEPPMYQQLQSMGRFTNFLALIDKSGYKATMNASGYWTMFAPNDSAFNNFFKDKGIASVTQID